MLEEGRLWGQRLTIGGQGPGAHRNPPTHLAQTQGPPWKTMTQRPDSQGEVREEGLEGGSQAVLFNLMATGGYLIN